MRSGDRESEPLGWFCLGMKERLPLYEIRCGGFWRVLGMIRGGLKSWLICCELVDV